MITTEVDWASHARRLANLLRDRGDIRTPDWHAAVANMPRHARPLRAGPRWSMDRVEHSHTPRPRVFAGNSGLQEQCGHLVPVSSSTKPDLMLRMLETLDVRDGHRVLEIGTGTGYNAALLSHRVGDHNVYSVDVDAELVRLARERLAGAGYRPTLAAIDGEGGLPEHAP